ncbi:MULTISPECIES: YHS domain-containing (seleno)protein [Deefgea]|uniref:YHS domain-containing protein n=1 Tax=Deefgea chitinilytica TaxID=570276 RepID=A0ABS2CAF0_9NEIS|nr:MULTISPECIES: YHS domain-containing (seleno)protein [Deefgea]MBM5571123.1 YHS domain-containing protein [Deefgea chitinilytica]MBM9888353.1 YHS domain-containing protein [Deefgea sp. CFH1-16]
MFNFRKSIVSIALISGFATFAALPSTAMAYDENSTAAINVDAQGVGLQGFDPVAYFTVKAPTLGNAAYTASHNGVTYHFASKANRDQFTANPAQYAPQFGGFCAMGVALDKKLDGDPQAWKVVDGKLYLNVNKEVQKKWSEDIAGNLKKANMQWPTIKDKAPKDL